PPGGLRTSGGREVRPGRPPLRPGLRRVRVHREGGQGDAQDRQGLPHRAGAADALTSMLQAASLCAWLQAAPPSPPPPPPHFQEDVVVTAERGREPRADTPAAVSVLARDDVEALPAESLGELLDSMPGFQVPFGGGSGTLPMVSARGFFAGGEADYVLLLVDGVPAADVESGLGDWRGVRSLDVERVEALRGPASAV